MSLNMLLSYAYHEKTDIALVRQRMVCGRLLIDSGAFTAFTKGANVDIDAYSEYLTHWAGHWDHAITLDVIGNPVQTAANTRKMHQRGIRVMPVFTRGEGLKEFDAMVKDTGYVCVGGLVGMKLTQSLPRIRMLQRRAADLGGGIHALGNASMEMLRKARPFSSDSSTPSVGVRYGNTLAFDGRILRQINIQNHARLNAHRDLLVAHGFPLAALVNQRKVPPGAVRIEVSKASITAFMVCDEFMKKHYPVVGVNGNGPFLYTVARHGDEALFMSAHDHEIHFGKAPSIWSRFGADHQCQEKGIAA